jgi:hypothetical protein
MAMQTRSFLLSIVIASGSLAACLEPEADSPRGAASTPPLTADEAFDVDAQNYARDVGISLERARFQLAAMRRVGDALADVEEQHAATFGGLRWNADPFYAEVMATQPIPGLESRLVAADIHDVELRGRTVRFSIAELNRRLSERRALVPEADLAGSWLDVATNEAVLGVKPSALEAVKARLAASRVDLDGVRLEPRELEGSAWGGARAMLGAGAPNCTTGFGLWETYNYPHYDPVHYFTTSAHCHDAAYIYCPGGCPAAGNATVIHGYQWHGDRYDFQAMYVPGVQAGNDFWDGSRWRIRTGVISWYSINAGDYLCKYGYASGYTCGFVITKYRHGYVPNSVAVYIETGNSPSYPNQSSPGDSGGPFFLGNSAVALMQGYSGPNQYGRNNAVAMSVTWITNMGWGLL